MASVSSVSASSDARVNALLGSTRWTSAAITYGFTTSASQYGTGTYSSSNETTTFGALNATQQSAARAAFAQYGGVSNLSFTEQTGTAAGTATLRLASSDAPGTAWAYTPSSTDRGGDAWFNKSGGYYTSPALGNYAHATFIHEIGHSLGLKHPHEGSTTLSAQFDSVEYSIMSYRAYVGASTSSGYTNETWSFPQSLMMLDIAAIQQMYGPSWSANGGNTTYSWSPTTGQMFINGAGQTMPGANRIFMTIWDGGGTDTYDFSNYATALTIDLRPGEWSTTSSSQLARLHWNGSQLARGNIANALQYNGDGRSLIENAIGGAGNDTIYGNEAANLLRGNGGNDTIYGMGGSDTVVFSGTYAQYAFSDVGNGGYRIADLVGGRDGADMVYQVEYLRFSDTTVAISSLFTPIGFSAPGSGTANFGAAQGWTSDDATPRMLGDINGDERDDIVAFSQNGVYVALSNGSGFNTPFLAIGDFTAAQGWTSNDLHLRQVGDVNGDGRDDIIAFGANGVVVALGRANGTFAAPVSAVNGFSHAQGWTDDNQFTRLIGDVNGDDRDDIIGFGGPGVLVSLGQANGTFGSPYVALNGFNPANGWTGNDQFTRVIGDVNGDGRADIVGFGNAVIVSLGQANGTFAAPYVALNGFNPANGWTSNNSYPRFLADVTGDGRDDIVGFGNAIIVAEALPNGTFAPPRVVGSDFVPGTGWSSQDAFPRWLGDVDNNGVADIVGFGYNGVLVALSDGPAAAAAYGDGSDPQGALAADDDVDVPDLFPVWDAGRSGDPGYFA